MLATDSLLRSNRNSFLKSPMLTTDAFNKTMRSTENERYKIAFKSEIPRFNNQNSSRKRKTNNNSVMAMTTSKFDKTST